MLSPRLQAVADRIIGPRHADIGSDHAQLPLALLSRLEHVIAIEKHSGPWQRSLQATYASRVELRRGNGLGPLASGEVDSLSICGLGSLNICDILQAYPSRLPDHLILQPADQACPLRNWAYKYGYHLISEEWVNPFVVLEFRKCSGPDLAYAGLDQAAAEFYGPYLSRNLHYRQWMQQQREFLKKIPQLSIRLGWIESLLEQPVSSGQIS